MNAKLVSLSLQHFELLHNFELGKSVLAPANSTIFGFSTPVRAVQLNEASKPPPVGKTCMLD
jgi:hypothetical protein